ncbi:hypothetical protein PT2222_240133 [Paraburkholderia tropica]
MVARAVTVPRALDTHDIEAISQAGQSRERRWSSTFFY